MVWRERSRAGSSLHRLERAVIVHSVRSSPPSERERDPPFMIPLAFALCSLPLQSRKEPAMPKTFKEWAKDQSVRTYHALAVWDAAMAEARSEQAEIRQAAEKAEHIRCLQVVESQIDAKTGPTGGWLDSPKKVFAEIALHLLHNVQDAGALDRIVAKAVLAEAEWWDEHFNQPYGEDWEITSRKGKLRVIANRAALETGESTLNCIGYPDCDG